MIGRIIKNMRLTAKLSQKELGNKLNMADTTVSSYERENSQPDFNTIIKIAKICDFEILFKDKEKDVYFAYVNKKSFNGCKCLLNVYLLG